mmetsp:Transcript_79566/g.227172  ORF Transcript_79566/g.227172 Transcript_79566/m.227172 type:complete len:214 (-) Transcript_79566:422-1063(-)
MGLLPHHKQLAFGPHLLGLLVAPARVDGLIRTDSLLDGEEVARVILLFDSEQALVLVTPKTVLPIGEIVVRARDGRPLIHVRSVAQRVKLCGERRRETVVVHIVCGVDPSLIRADLEERATELRAHGRCLERVWVVDLAAEHVVGEVIHVAPLVRDVHEVVNHCVSNRFVLELIASCENVANKLPIVAPGGRGPILDVIEEARVLQRHHERIV